VFFFLFYKWLFSLVYINFTELIGSPHFDFFSVNERLLAFVPVTIKQLLQLPNCVTARPSHGQFQLYLFLISTECLGEMHSLIGADLNGEFDFFLFVVVFLSVFLFWKNN